jgi:hypothetical protein
MIGAPSQVSSQKTANLRLVRHYLISHNFRVSTNAIRKSHSWF